MYLLAEAGSTKSDWLFFDEIHSEQFQTEGINPTIQSAKIIQKQLSVIKIQAKTVPSKIFFYGAGCGSSHSQNIITQLIEKSFPDIPLFIGTDLLAACRASCNNSNGIVCILGTGSHAALSDGHIILHQLPSLGYLLGDEGGGNHIGKELLKSYYLSQLDKEIKDLLEFEFPALKNDFLYELYQSHKPSSLLGSFAGFAIRNKHFAQMANILNDCIDAFIKVRLLVYGPKKDLPIHLCGSIGFLLKDEINHCLQKYGFKPADSIQKPITNLMKYHLSNDLR